MFTTIYLIEPIFLCLIKTNIHLYIFVTIYGHLTSIYIYRQKIGESFVLTFVRWTSGPCYWVGVGVGVRVRVYTHVALDLA